MDRLTSSELIRLILQESSPANSDELSHVLSLIFKSCVTEVPKTKDLKVLLKKIHPNTRIEAFQHIEDEATLVPLYDMHACRWNWPLPESHLDKLTASGERSNQAEENSSTDQGEREGENSGATNQRSGDWVFVDDTGAPAASESQAESVGQPEDDVMLTNASSASSDNAPVLHEINCDSTKPWTTEQVFASFNNLLAFALLLQQPTLTQKRTLSRIWSASNSSSTICGNEIMCKPDLILLDDIEARWDTIKAMYRDWLYNRRAEKTVKKQSKFGKKWTTWVVIEHQCKKEILEETGARPGGKEMIKNYQGVVNAIMGGLPEEQLEEANKTVIEWSSKAPPTDVQVEFAQKKAPGMMKDLATQLWRQAGMRIFILSAWKTEEGEVRINGIDFNEKLEGSSFTDTKDWKATSGNLQFC
ncbi:uncharacterized protein F5147DRAFT_767429 [Suillus discolor]|uniref:Uncharacterized protein n=1 Tax=Suillus discolor TaxID=1912936 RepID=A0A9P7FHC9_9AGAM|nr:uncharacterized protein F5147DRAFT_767429 [Suillus discolor]KAG2118666.1 hypothetical protein F5147DRAFT_767429 [Suillus discolor]